jgi:ABC-2 type transport system permease protein
VFDLRNVPAGIRRIRPSAARHLLHGLIKTLFLAGNVWPLILRNCAILAAYALVLLGLARFVTRKKLD